MNYNSFWINLSRYINPKKSFWINGDLKMGNDIEKIYELKTFFGVKTDEELAQKLEVSVFAVRNWKQRNSLPKKYELKILKENGIKLGDDTHTNDIACELMANAPEREYKNIDDIKQRLRLSTDQIAKLFRMEVSQIIKMKNNNAPIPNDLQQSARAMERVIYSLRTTLGGQDMSKNWAYINYEKSNILVENDKKLELIAKLIRYANDELIEQVMARLNEIERLSKI